MEIKVADMIYYMVENLLPRFSGPEIGLVLNFQGRTRFESGKKKAEVPFRFSFAFNRPGNYTATFFYGTYGEAEHKHLREMLPDDWRFTCDHDSCWRSDGVESPLNRFEQEIVKGVERIIGRDIEYGNGEDVDTWVVMDIVAVRYINLEITKLPDRQGCRNYGLKVNGTLEKEVVLPLLGKSNGF